MTNKSNTPTVTLSYPIEHGGKTINSVTLRRATVGDTLSVQGLGQQNPAEVELRMVSLLSGQPSEVIAKLDMQDYLAIQAALQSMMRPAG
jgi:hypothetical protein